MKLYQRFLLVMVTLALMVSLSGCIVIPRSKFYNLSAEEVTSVQFYDLRNTQSTSSSGFTKSCEPVYTVPEEKLAYFLQDFSKLEFTDTILIMIAAIDPSFNYGDWVVRVNFSNGQYTFYSCGGYGETFNSEGKCISSTHFSCDDDDLEKLIDKYYTK